MPLIWSGQITVNLKKENITPRKLKTANLSLIRAKKINKLTDRCRRLTSHHHRAVNSTFRRRFKRQEDLGKEQSRVQSEFSIRQAIFICFV